MCSDIFVPITSGVGRCSSKGVHWIKIARAAHAKIFDHTHFALNTTPIYVLTKQLATVSWSILACINEEMNGKSSRAHFVMC